MSRILISGGSGFIGSHLAEKLALSGYQVRVFDSQPFPEKIKSDSIELIQGDISDFDAVCEAVTGCTGLIHLSAVSRVKDGFENPLRCINTNIMGTANVLESIRRMPSPPWLICSSSVRGGEPPKSDSDLPPLYGITKFSSDYIARRYSEDYGIRIVLLRFSDVYGSNRDNQKKVLPIFVNRAKKGQPLVVQGPNDLFDFIHQEDITTGIQMAAQHLSGRTDRYFESIKLCTGKAITLRQLAELIVEESGSNSPIDIDLKVSTYLHGQLENDPTKARNILGFRSTISLREGISKLMANKIEG